MQPRSTISEQFSSFAWLEQDMFQGWRVDPRLARHLAQHLEQATQPGSERFWSLYWHRQWRDTSEPRSMPALHLAAYLQETCYWVAQEMRTKSSRSGSTPTYGLADFFQMALADLQPLLRKFDATTSNNLKVFARTFLSHQLKALLRQRREASFASRWGLLRRTSKKRVRDVLTQRGLGRAEIERYQLLWMTFKALYESETPGTSKLTEPSPEVWEQIATFYNQKRSGQLSTPGPALTAPQAAEKLRNLSSWIRQYCYPETTSLNTSLSGEAVGEDTSWERQDRLTKSQGSLVDEAIIREQEDQQVTRQATVRRIVTETFQQLPDESQTILCLLYQQQLSQQVIAKELKMTQPTVSRRIRQARQQLLKALFEAMGDETETNSVVSHSSSVNKMPDPKRLKEVRPLLDACLMVHLRDACNP